nr:MAG TPA: hypothetical protein [Caudoviricetes sp.]
MIYFLIIYFHIRTSYNNIKLLYMIKINNARIYLQI